MFGVNPEHILTKNNNRIKTKEMKTEILKLAMANEKTTEQKILLNSLVVEESQNILIEKGCIYNVVSTTKKPMKLGCCFANAVKKMTDKGFGYVEGYITNKTTGNVIAHAWNVDCNGVHIDFTLKDASDYNYTGIVVEDDVVREIGFNNGCIWFATLPFINNNK